MAGITLEKLTKVYDDGTKAVLRQVYSHGFHIVQEVLEC